MNQYKIDENCLKKEWHNKRNEYDLLETIMIYPAKEYDYSRKGLLEFTNILFNSIMDGEEKKYYLVKDYNITMTRELDEEMISMCNLSEGVKEDGRIEGRINSAKKHIKLVIKKII